MTLRYTLRVTGFGRLTVRISLASSHLANYLQFMQLESLIEKVGVSQSAESTDFILIKLLSWSLRHPFNCYVAFKNNLSSIQSERPILLDPPRNAKQSREKNETKQPKGGGGEEGETHLNIVPETELSFN